MSRSVTLDDVAAIAGVSGKTVSRVVNCDANVSLRTREKVEAAIAATGFRPNLAARSLAAARSFLVGTFVTDFKSYYYAELYRGAARACRRLGYHLVIEDFRERDRADRENGLGEDLQRGLAHIAYDGLILPAPLCDDAALLDALTERGIRHVRIAPAIDLDRSAAVVANDRAGVRALARHFWTAGHRCFGVLVGPAAHSASHIRLDRFAEAIVEAGGKPGDIQVERVDYGHYAVGNVRAAARRLLGATPRPTAIFAFNDEIAVVALSEAQALGLRIPADVAIAGFDDGEIAQLTWPQLTTIRQPIGAMAEAAVELLVAPEGAEGDVREFEVELVIRGSTADHVESE